MKEVEGNLITLGLQGEFDMIVHGCNCQSIQGAGIAKEMSDIFKTDEFYMETSAYYMNAHPVFRINKLGCIDWMTINKLIVVNAYTQIHPGRNASYTAIALCFEKINTIFKGKKIGIPLIGCGIGGLEWENVKQIVESKLVDNEVTVVKFKNNV